MFEVWYIDVLRREEKLLASFEDKESAIAFAESACEQYEIIDGWKYIAVLDEDGYPVDEW